MAQAATALAQGLEDFAGRAHSEASRLYAHYASHDLRKLIMLLRKVVEALSYSPDGPAEDCVEAAGRLTVESLNEALKALGSVNPDQAKLIDAESRFIEAAMVHALAYAKALTMLSQSHKHLAIALGEAAKNLHGHLEMLEKLKPLILSELSTPAQPS